MTAPADKTTSNPRPGGKERADKLLVERGLAPSRERAQALLLAGGVFSGGQRIDKPGHLLPATAPLEVRGRACPYVSRGGLKLAAALPAFGVNLSGAVCADIGASTGGFTDCMLQNGAARVYAVDVGRGQLHESLRSDPRVTNLEGTNARHLEAGFFPEAISVVTVDASFISLKLLLPAIRAAAPRAEVIALIKPQFEAGRQAVARGRGVIRDPALRQKAVEELCAFAEEVGYTRHGMVVESPVKGPKGNVEFLVHLVGKDQDG